MACFLNPAFWVYLICLIVAIAILKIVVPWFVSFFELPDPIGRIIMIILWGGGIGGALTFPHGR